MTRAKPTATGTEVDRVQELVNLLQVAKTSAELWRIGSADDFQAGLSELDAKQQDDVRSSFRAFDSMLKGKVKTEDIAGIPLSVDDWDFPPPSPKFPDSEFTVLKGVRGDNNERFELVSGATRVLRHFKALDPVKDKPQHIMLVAESPEQMAARNAKPGQSPMWLVKRLAVAGDSKRSTGGAPF